MSDTEVEIFIALLAGLLSGVLSEIGSAGAFVSLPMMISLGLPPIVANGTNRVGAVALYSSAYFGYRMQHDVDRKFAFWTSVPVVIGAIVGSLVAVHISDDFMQWMIVALTASMVAFTAFSPKLVNKPNANVLKSKDLTIFAVLLMFVAGIYCGLIMQAISYLIFFLLVRVLDVEIEQAKGLKFFLAMVVTPFSLVVFIIYGHIDWLIALFLIIGASLGGFLGERFLQNSNGLTTKIVLIVSFVICLLYLSLFILKHFSDGVTII